MSEPIDAPQYADIMAALNAYEAEKAARDEARRVERATLSMVNECITYARSVLRKRAEPGAMVTVVLDTTSTPGIARALVVPYRQPERHRPACDVGRRSVRYYPAADNA